MKKLTNTLILIIALIIAVLTPNALASEEDVYAQIKTLTANIVQTDKALQASLSTPENITECKRRLSMFKQYMEFQAKYPQRNQKFNESVIKNCQKRVEAVCGVIMSATYDDTEITND